MSVSNGQVDGSKGYAAQSRILQAGLWSAKLGPWSVTNQKSLPPSGDKHDYLSWAPYWWPNCNWCGQNSAQSDGSDGSDPEFPNAQSSSSAASPLSSVTSIAGAPLKSDPTAHPYQPLDPLSGVVQASKLPVQPYQLPIPNQAPAQAKVDNLVGGLLNEAAFIHLADPNMAKRRLEGARALWQQEDLPDIAEDQVFAAQRHHLFQRDEAGAEAAETPESIMQRSSRRLGHAESWLARQQNRHAHLVARQAMTTGTPTTPDGQRQNAIFTGTTASKAQLQGKAANGGGGGATCTPSRTYVAPTATYTVCPYQNRDGKINPDVKTLNNTKDVVSMAQSVLWNGVAFGLSNDTSYANRAASIIYTWFLNPQTAVNPNLKYGQVIRGPDKSEGPYTGILDWRMLMKVVNAVVIMRAKGAQAWNNVLATAMNKWASDYMNWLYTSSQGQQLAKASNNHVTFFYNQLISLYILVGDINSAQQAANAFFIGPFLHQINDDGEQPYEATRTRPFHYRCFNVEGLIANAKLADNLALNMWSAVSSSGATIQTAVDYLMTLDAGDEDVTELAPHVAAVAAAYGDPEGKYAAWLSDSNNTGDEDETQSWHFYNNPSAFYCNPGSGDTTSSQSFK